MSAWLLTPEHHAQLAIAWGKFTNPNGTQNAQLDDALVVAAKMAWTNWESYYYRYSHRENPTLEERAEYIKEVLEMTSSMKLDPQLSIFDLYDMVSCYAYQSCEWTEMWNGDVCIHKSFTEDACHVLKDAIIRSNNNKFWAYDNDKHPKAKLHYKTVEPLSDIISRYDLEEVA